MKEMVALFPKEQEACHWQFCSGKGASMRHEEESLLVGNKEPPAVWFPGLGAAGFLNEPVTCGVSLDCLEAVPVPAKHAVPFAGLLC